MKKDRKATQFILSPILIGRETKRQKYFCCLLFCHTISNFITFLNSYHSYTGCICSRFPHCAFLNVSSNCTPVRTQNHTGCICFTFLHCESSNVVSDGLHEEMHSHIGCTCFVHCVFSNVSSNCLPEYSPRETPRKIRITSLH